MGKWSNMKGVVPQEPEDPSYGDAVKAEQDLRRTVHDGDATRTAVMADFVDQFNALTAEKVSLAERIGKINLSLEAITRLITEALTATGSDIWRGQGYTFSEKVEPYASVADKQAVFNHFVPLAKVREDLAGLLAKPRLTRKDLADIVERLADVEVKASILSVPYQTLNAIVKAEADAGGLVIETVKTAEGADEMVVRSTVPGVKVFLKSGVNRRKV